MLLGGYRVLEYQLYSRRTPLIGPPLPVLRFTMLRTPATRNQFPNTLPPIFNRVKSPYKADKPLVISLSPQKTDQYRTLGKLHRRRNTNHTHEQYLWSSFSLLETLSPLR